MKITMIGANYIVLVAGAAGLSRMWSLPCGGFFHQTNLAGRHFKATIH
jgi:hypothetical protein